MTRTKGNVIVEEIQVGDIHYEFEYGIGIKCEVISKPVRTVNEDGEGVWTWKAKNLTTMKEINYLVTEGYEHYSSNLYDYNAYNVKEFH